MASGDTKTEAMLNALGNGGSADEFRGCCNTKTQQYILDAIDRVQNVEDEVEELKNNPDVVDIVDTYADLQAYDTQHLTENDIIRVLQDETHSGNSTYYRFTKNPDTWTFIGEISGGGGSGVTELTSADYNWPTDNPASVALWLLPSGVYTATSETAVRVNNNNYVGDVAQGCFVVGHGVGSTEIVRLYAGGGNPNVYLTTTASGAAMTPAGYKGGKILTDGNLAQATGTSTTNVMSQKAVTDALASAGSLILYAKTSDIVDQNQMSFYSDAAFTTRVTIGDIYNAAFNGKDIKIISKNVTEEDFDKRITYNVYKSDYPKVCNDESMNECGFNLHIIGNYGTYMKRAIVFETFSGPTYYEFVVSIDNIS